MTEFLAVFFAGAFFITLHALRRYVRRENKAVLVMKHFTEIIKVLAPPGTQVPRAVNEHVIAARKILDEYFK
jgi:hypothetical protein